MKNIFFLALCLISTFTISCVDRDFDAPPVLGENDPAIDDSDIITIAEIKALESGDFTEIGMSKYIKAVVVADDQSGNFYKSLVLQDETGGITILLDDVELWNNYYVGRRVFVDVSRMWLGEFNGLPQIGFKPYTDDSNRLTMARVPAAEVSDIIQRGVNAGIPEATVRTINTLTREDLNTLVKLEDVEFASGSDNTPFADSASGRAINHTVQDCSGNNIIMRTSGFADFADALTPGGNGTIVGIYGVFGSDKQLLARDLNDIALDGPRCDGSGGGGGPVEVDASKVVTVKSILDRRVDGVETNIGTESYLSGIVVSSDETGNFYKTIVVQDETGGIAIIVDKTRTYIDFVLGTEVYVALKDLFISDYNGLPQLGYAPSSDNVKRVPEGLVGSVIIKKGTVGFAAFKTLKIADLSSDNLNTYVEFKDVQFDDSSIGNTFADGDNTMSRNNTLEDCDGNQFVLRTSGFADFANDRIPEGNGSIKGILQVFGDTYQLYINYAEDINFDNDRCDGSTGGGGGGGGSGDAFSLDFENLDDFDDVAIEGWTNVAGKGVRVWQKRSFSGNGYAEAKAYQDDEPETDSWLVSPAINTAEKSSLSFLSSMAFYEHNGLTIKYTNDFNGDINAASWTNLDVKLATGSDGNYTWVESGNIDLSGLGGTVYIAFHYQGTSSQNTTTYRLDDIVIK